METMLHRPQANQLRAALLANAVFSLTTGSTLIVFSTSLAPLIGPDIPSGLLTAIGAVLLPFGGFAAWLGSRRQPDTLAALLVSLADLSWVAGSGLVLALAHHLLNPTGVALVLAVAIMVLGFALGQLRGIARVYTDDTGDRSRFRVCFDIHSNGGTDTIWRNLANLGEIARFAPTLASSRLRDDTKPAAGAVRDCVDLGKRRWSERCTVLDHERRELVMEFLAQEPGFPFPFIEMTGGWMVEDKPGGALVRVWWEGQPKYPILNPMILPLLAWQARRQFPAMVRLMSGQNPAPAPGPALLTIAPC